MDIGEEVRRDAIAIQSLPEPMYWLLLMLKLKNTSVCEVSG